MLTIDNVYSASNALKGVIRKTDVIYAPKLCKGVDLYLKTENLQVTGSFKVRGAYYKMTRLSKEEKANLDTLQHEASYFKSRKNQEVRLYAFTIGDIGFVSAPYEMFDTNGVQIRQASPCKMTFVCAYTNGHMGYCPSEEAFPHGAYEVEVSPFSKGDGEEFAGELVRLLHLCKDK